MSELSEWASRFADNVQLWRLESDSDVTGLFMTKERYGDGIPCYSYTTPVYHVWVDDKWVLSCMNYIEAYNT